MSWPAFGFSNAAPLSNLAILSSNLAFFNASFPLFGGGALAAFWWGVGSGSGTGSGSKLGSRAMIGGSQEGYVSGEGLCPWEEIGLIAV